MYSQLSACTNMNQIDNTDFFYVNKRLIDVAEVPWELSFANNIISIV